MSHQAYPLAWPDGWPRTQVRTKGGYRTSMAGALKNLRTELRLLCGDKAVGTLVLSSNVSLGVDNPKDPGVVAYFTWDGEAFAIPNDRWLLPEHNVQAIALTIEAIRAMERMATRDGTSVAHIIRRAVARVVAEDQGGLFLSGQEATKSVSSIRGRERASAGGRDAA